MSGLIDRHDLVAALDHAVTKKVTVLAAPAGSGKTSVLRLWADRAEQNHRIAFVTLQPGQDAHLFWFAVLSAIRAACGGEPPFAAPGCNGHDKVLSEVNAIEGPFVLVIDDAHELSSAEDLAELLADLPPLAHAIVATRGELPLHLHKLRLAGQLAEIRSPQLRFTVAETRELLAAAGITLPDRLVDLLHQRTEGWAAGLRLAVLSLAGHPDPERFVTEFSGSDRTVAEYLMAEMLERQRPDVQRLLLRTSLLDRVNGELADLLTGAVGAERILLDLEEANAFVVSLDPERTWFRYHHLFAGLLRLELRRTQADEIPALHRLAAGWFTEHGQPADAIRHLQAAGDWAEATRLLTEHALGLTLDGQGSLVRTLLHAFPAPGDSLALVYAIDELGTLRLDEAAAHLEVARLRGEHEMLLTALDLLLARLRGHFDCVVAQDGVQPFADPALRAMVLLNLGVTEAWSQRLADAERHLLEGAALARDLNRPYLEVSCLAYLGFASTGRSLALARQRCEEAIAFAARHGWDTEAVAAPAHATLAWVLVQTGEFDQASYRLEQVHQTDTEPGVQLLVYVVSALVAAARGHHYDALTDFAAARKVQASMAGEHTLSTQVTAWAIATQARAGMLDQARTALATAGDLPTAAAALGLMEGNPAPAAVAGGDTLTRVEAHLLTALAYCDLDDKRSATTALEQALDLAEPDRLILPFAITGAWQLLEALPAWDTKHAALVTAILDAVRNNTPSAPVDPLSPSELRVLRYLPTNLTRPEIAADLLLSLNTVNTHIRHIYAKLNASDRNTAVQEARAQGLLSRIR
ncbi:LuxR C-terminal-related transcriptional regulator [Kribbella sp. NPDC051587]|uniref:LuxR C-terminal-related transcriptional regulator n=1 Tax=Kribbella sp. NPDC051587 TaxID=3364119 RepID=UPI0037A094BF